MRGEVCVWGEEEVCVWEGCRMCGGMVCVGRGVCVGLGRRCVWEGKFKIPPVIRYIVLSNDDHLRYMYTLYSHSAVILEW